MPGPWIHGYVLLVDRLGASLANYRTKQGYAIYTLLGNRIVNNTQRMCWVQLSLWHVLVISENEPLHLRTGMGFLVGFCIRGDN